jgi:c-di-GMP-binding flagellar brake protein YcgR
MIDFSVNTKIDIMALEDIFFRSVVVDIQDTSFSILAPLGREMGKLTKGTEFDCILYLNEQIVGFNTILLDKRRENQIAMYDLKIPAIITPVQRRNNVRVDWQMKVYTTDNKMLLSYEKLKEDKDFIDNKLMNYLKQGYCINLSAGGIRLFSYEEMDIGDELLVCFELDGYKYLVRGDIRYKEDPTKYAKDRQFKYGICFLDITQKEEDMIIPFLFKIMRKKTIR